MTRNPADWWDEPWNPIRVKGGMWGCTKVSPACDHCWSEEMFKRFYAKKLGITDPEPYRRRHWEFEWHYPTGQIPPKTKKPTKFFVCNTSDLFHKDVPDEFIEEVLDVAANCPMHTFQILTKRPKRMASYFSNNRCPDNLWLGTTAENQLCYADRWQHLSRIKAKVKFLSIEPLIAPIKLDHLPRSDRAVYWIVIGCESGPDRRPCNLEWVRDLILQCRVLGIRVWVKQLDIDSKVVKDINLFPDWAQIREWPVPL